MLKEFLVEFDQEVKVTEKILACMPNGKFDWKPHPRSMAVGQLASHLANIPVWMKYAITRDSADVEEDFDRPKPETREELIHIFDKNIFETRDALSKTSEKHLDTNWKLIKEGKIVRDLPRRERLRNSMNHLIHHRAQLGVFLRLLDIPIPGSYGPSADNKTPTNS